MLALGIHLNPSIGEAHEFDTSLVYKGSLGQPGLLQRENLVLENQKLKPVDKYRYVEAVAHFYGSSSGAQLMSD